MSKPMLERMLDNAAKFCEAMFALNGVIHAQWHAVTAKGDHLFPVFDGDFSKDETAAAIRKIFEQKNVVTYLFFGEAWAATVDQSKIAQIARGGGVRALPNRIEVVTFQGEDHQTGLITAERRIIRPTSGKPYLGPLERKHFKEHAGRFVGLLPTRGAQPQ